MDDAFATLRNLPPHLRPYRFWIWLQVVILTFHVRYIQRDMRAMMVQISPRGEVDIVAVGDVPGTIHPDPLAFEPSKGFRLAMGEMDLAASPCRHNTAVALRDRHAPAPSRYLTRSVLMKIQLSY
ncbi:hypothetical protein L53_08360 [Hyphomonas sp. L-53-1-40]|uniref:hypothetical protein n=1 Tax=Hyphomonas sp. L-53-1-40 TaxID=1207058 RepID=UPI000458AEE8|nr:hypothetical protein [Hyphomonas sp. L-53-1-40]KCZ63274.1 hypothetical protein L53_08360 [Hyphomonas sp. L-53-1-40]